MTDKEFNTWKEEVQMEAIKFPHHAHFWFSNIENFKNHL